MSTRAETIAYIFSSALPSHSTTKQRHSGIVALKHADSATDRTKQNINWLSFVILDHPVPLTIMSQQKQFHKHHSCFEAGVHIYCNCVGRTAYKSLDVYWRRHSFLMVMVLCPRINISYLDMYYNFFLNLRVFWCLTVYAFCKARDIDEFCMHFFPLCYF